MWFIYAYMEAALLRVQLCVHLPKKLINLSQLAMYYFTFGIIHLERFEVESLTFQLENSDL